MDGLAPVFGSCQRWNAGRERYRPAGEVFDPSRCRVEPIGEREAKAFVIGHHYAASYPAARFRFGIFTQGRFAREQLSGVAVFGVPMNQQAVPAYFQGLEPNSGVELSRLVLLDELAANAESWFVARCFRLIRENHPAIRGVVSYADPLPRLREDGTVWKRGHVGCVYQALNGAYRGRASRRTLLMARDGRVFSPRAASKIRQEERGAEYAIRQLVDMGAPSPLPGERPDRYLARAVAEGGFRKVAHPGNHVYTWWLGQRRDNPLRALSRSPFPKG